MTEYESGWGSRPDGYIYSLEKFLLQEAVKSAEQAGDHLEYSRADGDVEVVVITAEFAKQLMSRKTYWTNKSIHEGDLGLIKDYSQSFKENVQAAVSVS